jgi:hypothetical protein
MLLKHVSNSLLNRCTYGKRTARIDGVRRNLDTLWALDWRCDDNTVTKIELPTLKFYMFH